MATNKNDKVLGAFSGVKGATWELEFPSFKIDGAEVSNAQLSGATFTGSIGGQPLSSCLVDPVPGVRLRAIVSAAVTSSAIVATNVLSDLRIQFADGSVQKPRFLFTVLDSPTP